MTSSLPINIQNFTRRYLIYSFSNASNLQRWKLKENSNCSLYDHKETQIHVFSNCKSALNRYEWRHNSVLKTLMNNLVTIASDRFRLYADIDGSECPSHLFKSSRPQDLNAAKYKPRPDIVIQENNKITIIELTCPFETNLEKFHEYKKIRYKDHRNALLSPRAHLNLILLEMSSSGFIELTKSLEHFLKASM